MFVGSQSFISLPSFMFVSAAVSEIRELKKEKEKEKKNSEMDYFQFNTFPGHLITHFLTRGHMYRFNLLEVPTSQTESDHQDFLTRVTFEHMYRFNLLEVPYITTESDHQDFLKYTIMLAKPGPSLYTQYYRTV